MNLDNLTTVLGILGAYFAVLLVMAVSVEAILEPFSSLPWLRKKLDPDDILNDIKEWLPKGSHMTAKAKAIENLASDARMTEAQLLQSVSDLREITDQATSSLGMDAEMTKLRTDLALKFAALRRKYAVSEKQRITILRIISALIGVALAVFLKVDSFNILGVLFPVEVREILTRPQGQVGGMIITGLAASAGSSFWHDILGRVRNLKETVQQIEK
jgi:hypothetical protein